MGRDFAYRPNASFRRAAFPPAAFRQRENKWPFRSADALKAPTYIEDKDSGELRRPHHVDLKSGMYRGRQVLKPKSVEE
ncbi:MAG: hypothetical protein FD172_3491 [Methylocystaceae bacterium]|nr:MAG: hypothetical protein FD172_3491 [Methylocystaceae bacterium]